MTDLNIVQQVLLKTTKYDMNHDMIICKHWLINMAFSSSNTLNKASQEPNWTLDPQREHLPDFIMCNLPDIRFLRLILESLESH